MRFGALGPGSCFRVRRFSGRGHNRSRPPGYPGSPTGGLGAGQNEPNPFCNATRMQWAAPVAAHVRLDILSPDGATLLRTLHDQNVLAGFWTLVMGRARCDRHPARGRNHPYRLRATNAAGALLFERTRTATVSCAEVGVEPRTWSGVRHSIADIVCGKRRPRSSTAARAPVLRSSLAAARAIGPPVARPRLLNRNR
jgi:hypothetical protein